MVRTACEGGKINGALDELDHVAVSSDVGQGEGCQVSITLLRKTVNVRLRGTNFI